LVIKGFSIVDALCNHEVYIITNLPRISRQLTAVQIMMDQNKLGNVEYFMYLGSMMTNDGRLRDVHGELNAKLPWQQKQSKRRRIFLAANHT